MPSIGSHTLFYNHNAFNWEPYPIYSYQCIWNEFCGVAKVAIGHGKTLEGMIITFSTSWDGWWPPLWLQTKIPKQNIDIITNTQFVTQGADGAAKSWLRTGTAKSDHLCQDSGGKRARERDRALIWTAWWHNWRHHDLSGHQRAGAGRQMNDSSVMEPHVALLCPSQTVFFLMYFSNSWFRSFGDFFPKSFQVFSVAIVRNFAPKESTDCNCWLHQCCVNSPNFCVFLVSIQVGWLALQAVVTSCWLALQPVVTSFLLLSLVAKYFFVIFTCTSFVV